MSPLEEEKQGVYKTLVKYAYGNSEEILLPLYQSIVYFCIPPQNSNKQVCDGAEVTYAHDEE